MEPSPQSKGWGTFFEHWGLLVVVLLAFLAAKLFVFFMRLSGAPWIWFFAASFAFMILGAALIGQAKIPAYRSGRIFAFGVRSVPEHLAGSYRWGWRVFLFGAVLGLCLLLSQH